MDAYAVCTTALAVGMEDTTAWPLMTGGVAKQRGVRGAVPHDLGDPCMCSVGSWGIQGLVGLRSVHILQVGIRGWRTTATTSTTLRIGRYGPHVHSQVKTCRPGFVGDDVKNADIYAYVNGCPPFQGMV